MKLIKFSDEKNIAKEQAAEFRELLSLAKRKEHFDKKVPVVGDIGFLLCDDGNLVLINGYDTRTIERSKYDMNKFYLESVRDNGLSLALVDIQTKEICLEAVRENYKALEFVLHQTEEICLEAIKKNPLAYKLIKQPTPAIQYEAVKLNGLVLKHISREDKTEALCLEAVRQNSNAIEFAIQTLSVCEEAITMSPNSIRHIENQAKDLCKKAVSIDGLSLEHIRDKTEEICIEAVKNNGDALIFIDKDIQTLNICEIAVARNGLAISSVSPRLISEKLCAIAIVQNPEAIKNISPNLLTEDLILQAVTIKGSVLRHLERQSSNVVLAAVKNDGLALEYAKLQTPKIISEALLQNGYACRYVNQGIDLEQVAQQSDIIIMPLMNSSVTFKQIEIPQTMVFNEFLAIQKGINPQNNVGEIKTMLEEIGKDSVDEQWSSDALNNIGSEESIAQSAPK